MIKSIYIDGLKSLKELKLELNSGLNVLVGPNGSGKSNIQTAFQLISRIDNLEGLNSVGSLGSIEIAKLFDVLAANKCISITVEGFVETEFNSDIGKNRILNFVYEFELGYDIEIKNSLYFKKQTLKVNRHEIKNRNFEIIFENYNFDIKNNDGNIFNIESMSHIEKFFKTKTKIFDYHCILNEFKIFCDDFKLILKQLKSLETLKIDPNIVRSNFEKISHPEICHDGDGLASVLLKICKSKKLDADTYESNANYDEVYNTVICYLQELLPEVLELNVEYDADKDKIIGVVKFEKNKGREFELPINLLSDGSLKWLTLVTALLTRNCIFPLEYPENFLNPKMQQLIIELMQETANNNENIIFSTHSETILNLLSPEEIILTNFKDGQTYVKRIENPDALQKAIEETGFGIGWRYVAGALD